MAQAKKPSLAGTASTKIQDFLTSDPMSLVLPAVAAVGAFRAPKLTKGALAGLDVFSTLQENKAARAERERKKAAREKLSAFINQRATALGQPTEDFVPQIVTEPGDERVGLRRVETPPTAANQKLSDVYTAAVEGGKPEFALEMMGKLAAQTPKQPQIFGSTGSGFHVLDQGATQPRELVAGKVKPPSVGSDREAIALARYGRRFSKLNLLERQQVNTALSQERINISGQHGAEAGRVAEELRRNRRIPPEIKNLVNIDVLTIGDAEDNGIIIPEQKQLRELMASRTFVRNAIRIADNLIALADKSPESFGTSGAFASSVNSLVAQSRNFARLFAIPINASLRPETYENTFQKIGIDDIRIKSQMIGLALATATASGQRGKAISDRDMEFALERVGAGQQDPNALVAVLEDLKHEFNDKFATKVEDSIGMKPTSLVDTPEIDAATNKVLELVNIGQIGKSSQLVQELIARGVPEPRAGRIARSILRRQQREATGR